MGEQQNDHDLLITLNSKVGDLINAFEELKEGNNKRVDDHEARIRVLEKESEDHILVKKVVYGVITTTLLTVLGSLLYLVIKR